MNALQHSVQDAPASPEGRPQRSGRLILRLAAVFLVFAAVGVALNCALGYINTRQTYLDAQSDRLNEVGAYVVSSATTTVDLSRYYGDWLALGDKLQEYTSYEQANADADAAYEAYQELYEASASEPADSQVGDEAQRRSTDEAYALSQEKDNIAVYFSFYEMLRRMRLAFHVDRLSMMRADEAAKTVTYVAASGMGVDEDNPAGVFQTGQDRSTGYDGLWQVVGTGQASDEICYSPDGAYLLVFVPFAVGGDAWVMEVALGTDELNEAVFQQMAGTVVLSCAVFAVCLAGILVILRQYLVRPVTSLSAHVRRYASDKDPQAGAAIRAERFPHDEVGGLARDVADMMDEMCRHVEQVARMSAETERVRSELAVASRIQLAALPQVGPEFSGGRGRFALFASMTPAKEVGGDFYDFFMLDAGHVAVLVADVSGKGVPAALFMMRAKALIRQIMAEGASAEVAMARANDALAADNDENMFVTVWLGVLDLESGELAFANCGHNPPAMLRADGRVEWLRERSGLLVGGFAGVAYRRRTAHMAPGDTLVLYTDGVTEAMDERMALFGEARLQASLASMPAGLAPAQVGQALREEVGSFVGGAEQADDITMLVLRYEG